MVSSKALVGLLACASTITAKPAALENGMLVGGGAEVDLVPRADIGDKSSAVGAIGDVVNKVVQLVQGMINDDIKRRQKFTQKTAADVSAQFPGQGVIVCNVGYKLSGPGDQLVYSTKYNAKVGSDVTFDVIVFKTPKTFDRQGDGGYENWAYKVPGSCNENGGHIECP